MIPLLEPNGAVVKVPPPPGWRGVSGKLENVAIRRSGQRSRTSGVGLTQAQERGLAYEAKVQELLCETFPETYWVSPVLRFRDNGIDRFVVPDGIIMSPYRVVVVEIKISHMPEAWWQLDGLYRKVLEKWSGLMGREIVCVEIARSYDPATPFPCPCDRLLGVDDLAWYCGKFGVVVCRM